MLDFYGLKLEDAKTGKVARSENWKNRYKNLNDHHHNFLRISMYKMRPLPNIRIHKGLTNFSQQE